MPQEPVSITGVHLTAHKGDVAVALEIGGKWVTVISEHGHSAENIISHIVEPLGIRQRAAE